MNTHIKITNFQAKLLCLCMWNSFSNTKKKSVFLFFVVVVLLNIVKLVEFWKSKLDFMQDLTSLLAELSTKIQRTQRYSPPSSYLSNEKLVGILQGSLEAGSEAI